MASMSNMKDMTILVRKKGLALTFTGSNEAQYSIKAGAAYQKAHAAQQSASTVQDMVGKSRKSSKANQKRNSTNIWRRPKAALQKRLSPLFSGQATTDHGTRSSYQSAGILLVPRMLTWGKHKGPKSAKGAASPGAKSPKS